MEQYETVHLSIPLDLSMKKPDGGYSGENGMVTHDHSRQSENCPTNIPIGPLRESYTSLTIGSERSTGPRRVAFVQPRRGMNIKARARGRPRGKLKILETMEGPLSTPMQPSQCREDKISLEQSPELSLQLQNQQTEEVSTLQANVLPGSQTVDSQAVLILTQQQTTPFAINHASISLNSFQGSSRMHTTIQNVSSKKFLQLAGCSVSSEAESDFTSASDHMMGASVNTIAMSQLGNGTILDSLLCAPVQGQVGQLEVFTDKFLVQNSNVAQPLVPVYKNLPGYGDLYMPTTNEKTKSCNIYEVTDVNNPIISRSQVVPYDALNEQKGNSIAEENNVPDVLQGQIRLDPQDLPIKSPMIVSTSTSRIPSPELSTTYEQCKNSNEETASGPLSKPHPTLTTKHKSNSVALFSSREHSKQEKLKSDSKDLRPSKLPQLRIPNNTSITSCRKILQEVSGTDDVQSYDEEREAMRRHQLEIFHAMNRKEKAAFLREKYAKLLKLRNKQLQMMDPKVKISLRKSSQPSREIQTLSKMTKLKCPPRILPEDSISAPKIGHSGRESQTSPNPGDKSNEPIVIDLTRDSDTPTDEQKEHEEVFSPGHKSRLPSYEEAVAAKERASRPTFALNDMSSVAKRLLSSSQEFLRNYHTCQGTSTPERTVHVRPKTSIEVCERDEQVNHLGSLNHIHTLHFQPAKSAELPQGNAPDGTFTVGEEQQPKLASDSLLSVALPEVSSLQTENIASNLSVGSTDAYSLGTTNSNDVDANNNIICELSTLGEAMASLEPPKRKTDGVPDDVEKPSSSHIQCVLNGTVDEKQSESAWTPSTSNVATVYVGEEKHILKNAVVRIQDIRKQSHDWNHAVENKMGDKRNPCLNTKRTRRRRRFSSQYHWDANKKQRKSSTSQGERRRRNSSPSKRQPFQDFVPTILATRTRNTNADHTHSYQTLAMELLDYDLSDVFNNEIDYEPTKDYGYDEDYSPRSKRTKRHHRKPKKLTLNSPDSDTLDNTRISTNAQDSCQKDCKSLPYRYEPIRVEIGRNSDNHIKLKFVNVRSIHEEARRNLDTAPSKRNQDQSPRGENSRKQHKEQPSALGSSESITRSPRISKQKEEKVCNTEVGRTCREDTQRGTNNAATSSSHPPEGMKKLIINKKFGETFLHRAAKLGNMEVLRHCIENRVNDVNARDNAGYTSLHDSCVPGHLHVAEFLLEHGADVNAESNDGIRPLYNAIVNNHIELVRILLAYGADPFLPSTDSSGSTCIQQALEGSSEMRDVIISYLESMKVPK